MANSDRITKEGLENLKKDLCNKFSVFNDSGKIDLDRCQLNVGYSIGDYYVHFNGLLLKEKHRLATFQRDLDHNKSLAYEDIKRNSVFDLDAKGIVLLIDGHSFVGDKQREYSQQKAFVEFLEGVVEHIKFYANGVKVILEREKYR